VERKEYMTLERRIQTLRKALTDAYAQTA
jgi:hypothetical protein